MKDSQLEYAGFWIRFGAMLIDTLLLLLVTMPLWNWFYKYSDYSFSVHASVPALSLKDLILNWIFPLLATVAFWIYRSATPGKMILKLRILDATTGEPLTAGKSILRYVAYYVSAFVLCLGFIWIAFSRKKQGWHDLIANTVVVRPANKGVEAVQFRSRSGETDGTTGESDDQ